MNGNNPAFLQTRRQALLTGFGGAMALTGLPAIVRAITASPTEEEGPFFVETHSTDALKRVDVRSNTSTGAVQAGLPLYLTLNVSKIVNNAAVPFSGAVVDIWSCNALGKYSDETSEGTAGQDWLRGYQITNAHGIVNFITNYPGFYQGRAVHIHARVRTFSGTSTTYSYETQLFLNDTISTSVFTKAPYTSDPNQRTYNTTDRVYNSSYVDTNPTTNAKTTISPSGAALLLRLAANTTKAVGSCNLRLRVS